MANGDDYSFRAGNINAGVFAQGKNARADGGNARINLNVGAPASDSTLELQRRIDELQRLLTQHSAALPDPERLSNVTDELGRQMRDPQPNGTVVRSLLDALTAGAGSVTAVLAAVNGLAQFIAGLL